MNNVPRHVFLAVASETTGPEPVRVWQSYVHTRALPLARVVTTSAGETVARHLAQTLGVPWERIPELDATGPILCDRAAFFAWAGGWAHAFGTWMETLPGFALVAPEAIIQGVLMFVLGLPLVPQPVLEIPLAGGDALHLTYSPTKDCWTILSLMRFADSNGHP